MKQLVYLALAILTLTGCKNNSSSTDKTPVAEKPLDELAPDATFNDVRSIVDILDQDPEYNDFLKLVNIAAYFPELKALDNVTLFAPTDVAIRKLSDAQYAELKLPQNLNKLRNILNYHIVAEQWDQSAIMSSIELTNTPVRLKTVQGAYLSVFLKDGALQITDEMGTISVITEPNMKASNGVIHGINSLVIPQE